MKTFDQAPPTTEPKDRFPRLAKACVAIGAAASLVTGVMLYRQADRQLDAAARSQESQQPPAQVVEARRQIAEIVRGAAVTAPLAALAAAVSFEVTGFNSPHQPQ